MHYVDHTKPPFIDISLPPAVIVPAIPLITLYGIVLGFDFYLLCNERHFDKYITPRKLRIGMTVTHIIIPMIFISNYPPCNILFAAAPWFLASYSAHMPTDQLTIEKWVYTLFKITIDDDELLSNKTKIRCKGFSKVALGIFKLAFMHIIINPILPRRAEYALEYAWLSPMSLIYTVLFGVKAYFLLGAVDVFMGTEQALFAWNMVDLFNSPIISSSPRDFWSRRWNNVVRNLLHTQVFADEKGKSKKKEEDNTITAKPTITKSSSAVEKPVKKQSTRKRTKTATTTTTTATVTRRATRSSAAAVAAAAIASPITTDDDITHITTDDSDHDDTTTYHDVIVTQTHQSPSTTPTKRRSSFWSTKQGRGLLAFIVSGVFHELIIMSACRKITLENLVFFILQGVACMIEVEVRQGALRQEPTGKTRILCIALQLFFMSITGRLFTGPFLRYDFFKVD